MGVIFSTIMKVVQLRIHGPNIRTLEARPHSSWRLGTLSCSSPTRHTQAPLGASADPRLCALWQQSGAAPLPPCCRLTPGAQPSSQGALPSPE